MKKRILAFLLAVSIAVSMLAMPAAAVQNNTAVQMALTLGAMDNAQTTQLNAPVTRGAFARMLTAFSNYRDSVSAQGTVGTLFADVPSDSANAPYVRIAVQNGWMNGYTDGSFRPDNAVTLEEACTAVLKLLGYKMTELSGAFPQAQLNKASQLGLRTNLNCGQGQPMNYQDCSVLLYNALTANTSGGGSYGASLGFTVTDGQVDPSSVMMASLKGPFIAAEGAVLPFEPLTVYRNDKASSSAQLDPYDVYYYSESLQSVWILHPPCCGPDHGSISFGQRTDLGDGGGGALPDRQRDVAAQSFLSERRRRRRSGHSAAGYEQRGCRHRDRCRRR